jgi:hypothetical protein
MRIRGLLVSNQAISLSHLSLQDSLFVTPTLYKQCPEMTPAFYHNYYFLATTTQKIQWIFACVTSRKRYRLRHALRRSTSSADDLQVKAHT